MQSTHEEAIIKIKRLTDINGNIVTIPEVDPWGANTNRSSASAFQPQNFTTYIRDGNGQQDAMARRYSPTGRFSQPDPYGGSYNFSDPQSLNRYSYTKNDPVNFRDPSGLDATSPITLIGRINRPVANAPTSFVARTSYDQGEAIDGSVAGFLNEAMMIVNGPEEGGAGSLCDGPPQINKAYAWVGDCNKSANDLMRIVRRDFSKFGTFTARVDSLGAVGLLSFDERPNYPGKSNQHFNWSHLYGLAAGNKSKYFRDGDIGEYPQLPIYHKSGARVLSWADWFCSKR